MNLFVHCKKLEVKLKTIGTYIYIVYIIYYLL